MGVESLGDFSRKPGAEPSDRDLPEMVIPTAPTEGFRATAQELGADFPAVVPQKHISPATTDRPVEVITPRDGIL